MKDNMSIYEWILVGTFVIGFGHTLIMCVIESIKTGDKGQRYSPIDIIRVWFRIFR